MICVAHARMRGRGALEDTLRSRNIPVIWTRRRGDTEKLAGEAARIGHRLLLVAGGDGTLHEAANGVIGTDTALGIIPGGTGNDVARMLGIPSRPSEAVDFALSHSNHPFDAGRISFPASQRSRIFVNIAEAGLGADAVIGMERVGRLAGRALAYPIGILSALVRHRPLPVIVRLDERELRIRRLTNLVVANGCYFGRGLRPAPNARPDDGLFDVLIMEDLSLPEIARKTASLKDGPPRDDPRIRSFRVREVRIDGPSRIRVEADGEFLGNLPACIRVIPHGLFLRAPAETRNG